MATAKEREEFIGLMVAEYCPRHSMHSVVTAARALLRHARMHGRLAVEQCNGFGDYEQALVRAFNTTYRDPRVKQHIADAEARLFKNQERAEKRIREICAGIGAEVHLGGDPRGYTVKVKLPSGAYNTWGGSQEGYGVPQ
ncbi:MAG: hypothetical protein Q7J84_10540 [Sulfuricaulis sp.]|nr:hypothetical protein [Sulfuricaulis sp.]